jgi:RNA polymerase sigma factor (sigma-70 family)
MSNLSQPTEFERLMAELALGSEDAAWQLAETYTPHILRAVRASLPSVMRTKLDSQDFAQSVWASLLLKRTYLSRMKTPQQLIGLLVAAARYKVVDAYLHFGTQARDVRREQPLSAVRQGDSRATVAERGLTVRDPSPSQTASLRERWSILISQCSARDRQIVVLRIKGNTYQEISNRLGISSATVRRVVDRIIRQLST